jgi:hypothetical protein
LKLSALLNMYDIEVTWDVSHPEISSLNCLYSEHKLPQWQFELY